MTVGSTLQAAAAAAAWLLLALVAFWTLGPLADRPRLGPAQVERFSAFFALAVFFTLAYRRPRLVAVSLAIVAAGLEVGQLFVPGRDAGLPDALAKIAGALCGVLAVVVARRLAAAKTPWGPKHVGD
jgi:VanZ family protein